MLGHLVAATTGRLQPRQAVHPSVRHRLRSAASIHAAPAVPWGQVGLVTAAAVAAAASAVLRLPARVGHLAGAGNAAKMTDASEWHLT